MHQRVAASDRLKVDVLGARSGERHALPRVWQLVGADRRVVVARHGLVHRHRHVHYRVATRHHTLQRINNNSIRCVSDTIPLKRIASQCIYIDNLSRIHHHRLTCLGCTLQISVCHRHTILRRLAWWNSNIRNSIPCRTPQITQFARLQLKGSNSSNRHRLSFRITGKIASRWSTVPPLDVPRLSSSGLCTWPITGIASRCASSRGIKARSRSSLFQQWQNTIQFPQLTRCR